MTKLIVNVETGEETLRELNDEELKQMEALHQKRSTQPSLRLIRKRVSNGTTFRLYCSSKGYRRDKTDNRGAKCMKNSDLTVLAEWLAALGIYIIKINHEKNTIEIAPPPTRE